MPATIFSERGLTRRANQSCAALSPAVAFVIAPSPCRLDSAQATALSLPLKVSDPPRISALLNADFLPHLLEGNKCFSFRLLRYFGQGVDKPRLLPFAGKESKYLVQIRQTSESLKRICRASAGGDACGARARVRIICRTGRANGPTALF